MPPEILTIGHSTHTLDYFLGLLAQHRVEALVDIRRFPGSRKYPQFGQESLAAAVREAGIEYLWLEVLGGRRSKPKSPSVNLGLRNESFRNYADYMPSAEFHEGMERLLDIARRKRTAARVNLLSRLSLCQGC